MISEEILGRLYEAALEQRRRAWAPYSSFAVGAAVQSVDGTVFTGCNVENASYGLSMCAERVALFRAVAAGVRQFAALVVVASPLSSPCGACRQVMSEFFGGEVTVAAFETGDPARRMVWTLDQLLPERFRLRN